ncbi:proteoglycan 4 [Triplophysa rosa]|nr:proteoglycan 4 [Triplophysa rosa]
MSSKGGRHKRTKNVRKLDAHDAPSLDQSIIDKRLNIIPEGRQLERTPPSKIESVSDQITKAEDSTISQQVIKDEPCTQEMTINSSFNGSSEVLKQANVKDERKSVRRSSLTAATATSGNADPETFIQGMQGYQWTDTDLEFVYQTKCKKKVQKLQQEISDVLNALKSTRQVRDVAVAAHEKIQEELSKMSSCERVQEMSKETLLKSQSSVELEGLDFKGLLAQLKVSDVQHFTSEERTNISKLNPEVTKAQAMRENQEQFTKDIDTCKVNIDQIKVNIQTMTAAVAALESQLSVKEAAALSAKPRKKVQRGPKPTTAPSAPKPSTNASFAPKRSADSKPSSVPKPPSARSAPNGSTAPKPPTSAPKASTAPKPSSVPKPPSARSAPKGSTAPKPPTSAPKASTAPKPSSVPKPPSARSAPKGSTDPKPPTSRSAPKGLLSPKPLTSRSAPKASKATTAPNVPEGDVGGLRRSKRIAAKQDK